MERKLSILLIIMSLSIIIIFTACFSEEVSYTNGKIPLDKVPEIYDPHTAKQNGDVVIGIENYNIEKVEQFVANIQKKEMDKLRIVLYTTEGDPIIYDLYYDGNTIKCTEDYSRDKFADKQINTQKHSYINSGENQLGELQEYLKSISPILLESIPNFAYRGF